MLYILQNGCNPSCRYCWTRCISPACFGRFGSSLLPQVLVFAGVWGGRWGGASRRLYYLPQKLLLPSHALLRSFSKLESSVNKDGLEVVQVVPWWERAVADSCDSLVRRWGMLAAVWRGHGVLLSHAAFGA